jgi:hypothetical protein
MFAIYRTSRAGQPWTEIEDARLRDDCKWGADSVHALALRQGRTEAEVRQLMQELGLKLNPRGPHSRRVVGT